MTRFLPGLDQYWELLGIRMTTGFFSRLPTILPRDAVLIVEDTLAGEVQSFLAEHAVKPLAEVERGSSRSEQLPTHVPITPEIMNRLEQLSENYAAPEVCMHLLAYSPTMLLLEWFDAFDDPLYISLSIPESDVSAFSNDLGAQYRRVGRELTMSTIDKIKAKLERYPQLTYTVEGNRIVVDRATDSGFSVWLTVNKPRFTVGFDGWHEEFDDETEALNAFTFGLSDRCRLKVIKRGSTECGWVVEGRDEDNWREDSTTRLSLVPFWKKKTAEYRQNNVVKMSELDDSGDGDLD